MTCAVVPAPKDAPSVARFIDYLQAKDRNALGFLPFIALQQAVDLGRVFLCLENDEPAGYVIHGPAKTHGKIYQVCVADDARRIEHGTALVEAVRSVMIAGKAHDLTLHCAEDLTANTFWRALGFAHTGQRCKRQDRRRMQNRYQIELPQKALDAMMMRKQLEADGLTNLRRLLMKGDIRHGGVSFKRKQARGHQIYLPPDVQAELDQNGTR